GLHRHWRIPFLDVCKQHSAPAVARVQSCLGRCPTADTRGKLGATDEPSQWWPNVDQGKVARGECGAVRLAAVYAPHLESQKRGDLIAQRSPPNPMLGREV